jgi:hypothetical protein
MPAQSIARVHWLVLCLLAACAAASTCAAVMSPASAARHRWPAGAATPSHGPAHRMDGQHCGQTLKVRMTSTCTGTETIAHPHCFAQSSSSYYLTAAGFVYSVSCKVCPHTARALMGFWCTRQQADSLPQHTPSLSPAAGHPPLAISHLHPAHLTEVRCWCRSQMYRLNSVVLRGHPCRRPILTEKLA